MFKAQLQSFNDLSEGQHGATRVKALRQLLKKQHLGGFIVPRSDEHQGEYVPPSDERLAWISGFTGSAGVAVVLADKAAILVDGRYTGQSAVQTNGAVYQQVPIHEISLSEWLAENAPTGSHIGYDPALHTPGEIERLTKKLASHGIPLTAVAANPVDAIWSDRPAPPLAPVFLHPKKFAGETAIAKITSVQDKLARERLDALVVSDPHAVAWLFNIRGGDVTFTPLPLCYALVSQVGKPSLFIDGRKLTASVRAALAKLCTIHEPAALQAEMARLAPGKSIRLDHASAGIRLKNWVEAAGGIADIGADPIALMKARKNAVEQEGARAAHLRDGAALTRFLCWFDIHAASGTLTEIDAVGALEHFRRQNRQLKGLSFPSISGANAHAALPHYRVSETTNAPIEPGVFLIDSGAQYADGTTDVTRTIAIGKPAREIRERNTLVLKGMIAISLAVFPKGTSGAQLDSFARAALWQAGMDFDHGTGHGIGSYLSVHEGPHRISKLGTTPLEPGMIVSNEPGYYKPGAYGIRIENLVLVQPLEIEGAERTMYGFETLTLAPIDRRLIVKSLLTKGERDWMDAYHKRVRKALTPLLDIETANWLKSVTTPL